MFLIYCYVKPVENKFYAFMLREVDIMVNIRCVHYKRLRCDIKHTSKLRILLAKTFKSDVSARRVFTHVGKLQRFYFEFEIKKENAEKFKDSHPLGK